MRAHAEANVTRKWALAVGIDKYVTRRGEKIEIRNNQMFVDGRPFNQNLPRLSVVNANGNEFIRSLSSKSFRLGDEEYDFGNWSSPQRDAILPSNFTRPAAPKNVKISP